MEVCGGQTHAIVRFGLDELLPPEVTLLHGPGCPVCVTPVELIDQAVAIAARPGVIFCSFGDMLRVPGSARDLLAAKAAGGDVRVVYSPLDALALAERHPGARGRVLRGRLRDHRARQRDGGPRGAAARAPQLLAPRLARARAARDGGDPGRARPSRGRLPGRRPRLHDHGAWRSTGRSRRATACRSWSPASSRSTSCRASTCACAQLEEGRAEVENQYARAVRDGRQRAGAGDDRRGVRGGAAQLARHRADSRERARAAGGVRRPRRRAPVRRRRASAAARTPSAAAGSSCRACSKPPDCPAFGTRCTPETPLGATMVSSEGACAAYYRYRRFDVMSAREFVLSCPPPLRHATVQLAHGGGGRLMRELIEEVFLPAFANPALDARHDSAVVAGRRRRGSPSRPTPTWSSRASSPAATSGGSPCTAR